MQVLIHHVSNSYIPKKKSDLCPRIPHPLHLLCGQIKSNKYV
uniref:Uncharacterized protein n=1 Tax=Rhizophora mucronata TaxID=61149 RepID=A0A2P2QXT0_RHIMU